MQFQRATKDLNTLITHVGAFVDWWADMNTGLKSIRDRLPLVMPDGSNQLQTGGVAKRWKEIRAECHRYQQQVLFGPLVL